MLVGKIRSDYVTSYQLSPLGESFPFNGKSNKYISLTNLSMGLKVSPLTPSLVFLELDSLGLVRVTPLRADLFLQVNKRM